VEPEVVRQQLDEERARLAGLRSYYDDDHLTSESEGESIGALSANAQHQADIGTETFDRERDLTILEHIDAELSDIEHALRRLEDGSYGVCEACGGPIGDDRLEAVPAARFCLRDQATAEDEVRSQP
jgi:RNA polymerase-binding transcription factor DksA